MWSRPSTRRARAISSTPASSGRCSPGSSSSRPFGSPTRPRRFSARVSAVAGRFRRSRRRAPLPVSEATAMDPSRRAAPRAAPPSPMSSSLSELVARLERALEAAAPVRVAGLRGSGPALCLARLLARRPRAALVVAATAVEAEAFAADLRFLLGDEAATTPLARRVHYLPGWEVPPFEPLSPPRETVAARAEGLYHLVHTTAPVVVTTAEAWGLRCLPRAELAAAVTYVVAGETVTPDALVARLVEWGYHRVPLVQDPGDLALRGGILDVFPVGYGEPARLEFMGDAIESMRAFDPTSQRSLGAVDELLLLPLAEFGRARLGPESARAIDERAAELGLARRERRDLVEAVRTGLVLPGTEFLLPYFYADLGRMADYLPPDTVLWLQAPAEVEAAAEAGWVQVEAHAADAAREGRFHPPPERLYLPPAAWREGLAGRPRVEAEAIDVLDDAALVATSYSTDGLALRDPAARDGPLAAVAAELAGWQRQGARLVVVATGAAQRERIRELLAGHDVDAVPSAEPFPQSVATPGRKPLALVGGLGGGPWERVKAETREWILAMARERLAVYAGREAHGRPAYGTADGLYRDFAARFPFEETPDQQRAIDDVLADLARDKPMDRLVCGDVGFGKTEVAMRAAFLAVLEGKQVAVLVPTTVLAQQHLETFVARFAGYPVSVGVLSRFQSPVENKRTIEQLRTSRLDVVIGTHRLLQKDVAFQRLGLLIVDEEHRFGVRHKERIRQLRATVDLLTLTATPIPRTLNMALSGIRDLSVIETPPLDRLAIRTYVTRYDEAVVRDAILRELGRGGQVFFVHNRVENIDAVARRLGELVLVTAIAVAHGQMEEGALERTMLAFMHGQSKVLVTSAIIESGLDIPNANTIIINRADTFGLAQLYQLRGRVGRSHPRASAYLLIPGEHLITAGAQTRLRVPQALDDLGGGFRLAAHDPEIRGGGNLLGKQQSGHITAVGLELYTTMMEQAVRELRCEPAEAEVEPEIQLGIPAFIPDRYIPDVSKRLVFYKRLAAIRGVPDLDEITAELVDRYGPVPPLVDTLMRLMELRRWLKDLRIVAARRRGERIVLEVAAATPGRTDTLLETVRRSRRSP